MQPDQTSQETKEPADLVEGDEKVLAIVHKHWVGLLAIYILAGVGLVSLIALSLFVLPDLHLSSGALRIASLAAVVAIAILGAMLYVIVYVYKKSQLTLTDQSLVQMVQRGLFNKKISRLSMSNVEDVNVEQKGILAHLFNYGTLTVQTAGEEDNFLFNRCPKANVYADQILQARQTYARRHSDQTK